MKIKVEVVILIEITSFSDYLSFMKTYIGQVYGVQHRCQDFTNVERPHDNNQSNSHTQGSLQTDGLIKLSIQVENVSFSR